MADLFGHNEIRGLSLTQPWAWLVTEGPKDIEHRVPRGPWRRGTAYRGLIAIHAAKRMTGADYKFARDFVLDAGGLRLLRRMPKQEALVRSAIVGFARIVAVIGPTNYPARPWHMAGQYGFVLEGRRAIEPIPCSGALGLWRLPADVESKVRAALRGAA